MSTHIEWLDANYTEVDATATPGTYLASDGFGTNTVAAIKLGSTFSGDGIVIQGPPETLVLVAERMLDQARLLVVLTNKSPELRSLYGRV